MYLLAIEAYILGSIPFAQIVAGLCKRIDLRKTGSGNVGATNVFQQVGLLAGLLAAVGDVGKGVLAAYMGIAAGANGQFVALLLAIIGHNWPVWLGFRGGGGLATFIGGMLVISNWWIVLILLGAWGSIHLIMKEHNRSAIVACSLAAPILGYFHSSLKYFLFGLVAALVVGLKRFFYLIKDAHRA